MPRLITLTTDFGTRDFYVPTMKGVILNTCPGAQIVDLTHEIAPRDLMEAALFISATTPYFPPDTIHVIVVDPGVGTERLPIVVAAANQVYVCPNNGLLTLLVKEYPFADARIIGNPEFMRRTISKTFHGRDVFAPAAAQLALGASMADVGVQLGSILLLDLPEPERIADDLIIGRVIHVDRFGNLITNIPRSMINLTRKNHVKIGELILHGIHGTYASVDEGEPLALINSTNRIEVAVNRDSAAEKLQLGRDVVVEVSSHS